MTEQPDQGLPDAPPPELVEPPPVPPESAPDLMPYATWRQDDDQGARAAHDDAKLLEAERMTPDEVSAEGHAFWDGYSRHMTALRNAGVIR